MRQGGRRAGGGRLHQAGGFASFLFVGGSMHAGALCGRDKCRLAGGTSLVLREVEDEQLGINSPETLGEALQARGRRAEGNEGSSSSAAADPDGAAAAVQVVESLAAASAIAATLRAMPAPLVCAGCVRLLAVLLQASCPLACAAFCVQRPGFATTPTRCTFQPSAGTFSGRRN